MKKLLTEKELQEKLSLSRSTLVRLRKKGLPYKKIDRSIRYDEKEVMQWIETRSN
jgi:predicted DNA-binding transcriptional regulator AlpA